MTWNDRGLDPTTLDREAADSNTVLQTRQGWEDPDRGFDSVFGVYESMERADQPTDARPPAADYDRPADVARGIQEYARGGDTATQNVEVERPSRFLCRAVLITVGDQPAPILAEDSGRKRATVTVIPVVGTPTLLLCDEAVSVSQRNPIMSAIASNVPYVFEAVGALFGSLVGNALDQVWVNVIIER